MFFERIRKKNFIRSTAAATAAAAMIASGIFFTGASDVAIQNDVLSRRTLNAAVEAELESRGLRAYPNQAVTIYVDGEQYEGTTLLIDGTTFVGIREFTMLCEDATVEWVGAEKAVYVTNPRVAIKAVNSTEYIMSNGRYFWGVKENFIESGTMYVPIRAIASAFGMTVSWNDGEFAAYVSRGDGTVTQWYEYYKGDEVYWLSKIIEAESRGEPMRGKIAVGNVVLNRVRSPEFPDTIYSVIFDREYGVQFSPVADGSIGRDASAESVIAAKLCLEGYSVSDSVLYFINASAAQDFWVPRHRPYVTTIGNHDFYA